MRTGTMASVGVGLVASVVVHLLLLVAVAIPHQRENGRGEAVAVELVSAEEAAPAFKDEKAPEAPSEQKAEQQPDFSQLEIKPPVPNPELSQKALAQPATPPQRAAGPQASPQQAQPQAQQQVQQQPEARQPVPPQQQQPPPPGQQPQAPPQQAAVQPTPQSDERASGMPTETLAEHGARLAALLALPFSDGNPFGSEAETKADLQTSEMAAFKSHLKKCWTLPPGYSETQKVKVIVRIVLKPDGRLAVDPDPIEVSPAKLGVPLWINAKAALEKCQPYTMLPPEKYKEWRVLDLNFSPDQMAGG